MPRAEPSNDVVSEPPVVEDLFTRSRRVLLEPRSSAGGSFLFVLLFVVFVLGQMTDLKSPLAIATLIGVLLFHEAGHALGMKAFGFRDVRMFFIPFLGAAVSGRSQGAAAWKEAVVSLLGPLPGIALAVSLLFALRSWPSAWLTELIELCLLLNLFNLLPVGSLDGGRFLQRVFFSRHPVLDVGFQLLGAALLAAFALSGKATALLLFTIPTFFALPRRYQTLTAARALSIDRKSIERDPKDVDELTLRQVYAAARDALPVEGRDDPKYVGESMGQMLEAAKRPPGLWVTLGLLALYVASLIIGAIGVAVAAHENAEASWRWVDQPSWRAEFPQDPIDDVEDKPFAPGYAPSLGFRAATKGAQRFAVTMTANDSSEKGAAWLAHQRSELEREHGYKLLSSSELSVAGSKGHAHEFKKGWRTLWMRTVIVGGHAYQLTASGLAWGESQRRFFDSFSLKPTAAKEPQPEP